MRNDFNIFELLIIIPFIIGICFIFKVSVDKDLLNSKEIEEIEKDYVLIEYQYTNDGFEIITSSYKEYTIKIDYGNKLKNKYEQIEKQDLSSKYVKLEFVGNKKERDMIPKFKIIDVKSNLNEVKR